MSSSAEAKQDTTAPPAPEDAETPRAAPQLELAADSAEAKRVPQERQVPSSSSSSAAVQSTAAGSVLAQARGSTGGGGSKSIDLEAGAAPAEGRSEDEPVACLICLEEEVAPGDHLFHDICACRNTAIHRACLEKLVNSRRRRKLDIDERLACPVCVLQYKVPYERTLIQRPQDELPEPARPRPSAVRSLGSALLLSFAAAFGVRVLVATLGRQVAFLVVTLCVFAFMFYIVYGSKRTRRRLAADDPENMDDETFYSAIVTEQRSQLNEGSRPSTETLARARNHRIVLHIGIGDGPGGALVSDAAPDARGGDEVEAVGVTASDAAAAPAGNAPGGADAPGGPVGGVEFQRPAPAAEPSQPSSAIIPAAQTTGGGVGLVELAVVDPAHVGDDERAQHALPSPGVVSPGVGSGDEDVDGRGKAPADNVEHLPSAASTGGATGTPAPVPVVISV